MASFLVEGLQQALSKDIPSLVLSAATLGVLSHASIFRSLPVEEHLYSLLSFYAAAVIAVAIAYLMVSTASNSLSASLFTLSCNQQNTPQAQHLLHKLIIEKREVEYTSFTT